MAGSFTPEEQPVSVIEKTIERPDQKKARVIVIIGIGDCLEVIV
jgi:hypothetical protein